MERNYKNDIKKQIRWCIAIIVLLLFLSTWFGFNLAISDPQTIKPLVRQTLSQYDFVRSLNLLAIFLYIFLNNAIKGFLVMIFGTIFGLTALVFIYINGQLLGLVLGIAQFTKYPSLVIWEIAPHGVLEIPALVLSASYGLWLGYRFYRVLRWREPFKIYFRFALRKFFHLMLPLILVAAIIETFVTPLVIALVSKWYMK